MTMITPSYLGETIEYSSLHACRSTLEDPTPSGVAWLSPTGFFRAGQEWNFAATQTERSVDDVGLTSAGRVWVERVAGSLAWVLVQQAEPRREGWRDLPPRQFFVFVSRFVPGTPTAQFWTGTDVEDGVGGGALFDGGGAAVAMTDGRLVLVGAPQGEGEAAPMPKTTRKLAFHPYEISIAGDHIALLEAVGVAPGLGDEGPYSQRTDLALRWSEVKPHWSTRLHVLNRQGVEIDQATVPFPVLQPPIDGENGRFYLAGLGFAAAGGGKVAYWSRAKTPSFATAMLHGDVAISIGHELRLVARDGGVRQSFRVSPGETITTPPAVSEDGAIWVATDKALYVAR